MNKPLLTLAFILQINISPCFGWQASSFLAGAAILLNNHDSDHPIFYGTIGNPAAGGDFYVQILGGPDANHLQPISSVYPGYPSIFHIGTTLDAPGVDASGFFNYGMGIVPGVFANAEATFQLRAWTGAPTFEAASQKVASALFTQETGDSRPVAVPTPAPLHAFPANLVIPAVPEPSILRLCFVGVAVWFAARW